MSAILSDNFRFYNLENFISSISTNSIYMFIGKSYEWDAENSPASPLDNPAYLSDIYDQMIALKKLSQNDVIPVVDKITWSRGNTYDMYRPDYTTGNSEYIGTGSSITGYRYPPNPSANNYSTLKYGAKFYVMNEFYQVYKCLYNGQSPSNPFGVPSTIEPIGVSVSPFTTADGYTWKYMYTIPTYYVLNFINDFYIPVPYSGLTFSPESAIINSAIAGGIDTIVIKQSGSGYTNGTYVNVPISGDGVGGTATILVSGGQIEQVSVTTPGSGYSFASINLSDIDLGSGSGGLLEVIIPPKYGHGTNPYEELGAYKLMLHTSLSYNEPKFPTDISYRRIGLVANPYVKGSVSTIATDVDISQTYSVSFSSVSGTFNPGDIITQDNTNATGRVVSWSSGSSVLNFYQDRWDGKYNQNLINFQGNNPIRSSNAVGTGVSNYTYPEIEKNTGKILYIDNRLAVNRSINQIEDIKIVVEF